jgi:hypothetical protein
MTIERTARWVGRAIAMLGLWAAIMLAMPFVGPLGRQVAVIGDASKAARVIAGAGGYIIETRRGATLARSDDPHFVRRLYAAGADAVIEGRIAAGCFAKAGA